MFVERQRGEQAKRQRQHHRRGRGVADPHRQEGGQPEQPAHRAPEAGPRAAQDLARHPAVQPLALQAGGEREAAEEEEDHRVGELQQGLGKIQHSARGGEQGHQQRGHAHVQGFGQPQPGDRGEQRKPGSGAVRQTLQAPEQAEEEYARDD